MRLSQATLPGITSSIRRPAFVPSAHGIGVVHLGLGAFHRAHQAVYLDDLLALIGGDWRSVGVSLRSPDVRHRLAPQDHLYTIVEGANETEARIIGSIAGALVAPADPSSVLARLADPAVRLITLTITEKGYGHTPSDGRLDRNDPGIAHDLTRPVAPVTAIGYLVEALAARKAAGHAPPAIVSCDNLPGNGALLKGLLVEFAGIVDPGLAEWIERLPIPSSMVDRIVPATTRADIDHWERGAGYRDEGLVLAEPFRQWLIEERGAEALAPLAAVGVGFVSDIRPFEKAKLRLVNAAHTLLAFTGLLAGHEFVHQAAGDPVLRRFVARFMLEEVHPTLAAEAITDVEIILGRFDNPALKHRLVQIATDSPQKVPQRLLGTIGDLKATGQPFDFAALGLAAWFQLLALASSKPPNPPFNDPLSVELQRRCAGGTPAELVEAALSFRPVFGSLGDCPEVCASIVRQLAVVREQGLNRAMELLG